MKFLVILAVAVAWASADVSHVVNDDAHASVAANDYNQQPDGSYQYAYQTSNGIFGQAAGVLLNPNSDHASLQVTGEFRYPQPNGSPVQVTYVADENGYQPQGEHLPTAPPTPEAILRSLAYIAAHPPQQEQNVAGRRN